MRIAVSILTIATGFITAGLIFAFVKRRQGAGDYLLCWPNPLSPRASAFLRAGFFRGTAAELSRILIFGLATFISAVSLLESME